MCQSATIPGKNGSFTLSAALFQETWPGFAADNTSSDHNSAHLCRLRRFTWPAVLVAQFAGDALVSLGNSQARFKIHISAPTKSSCDSRSASKGVNNKPMNLNRVRHMPNTITVQRVASTVKCSSG
eukprot:9204992-Alexandrium_andersonii.AAC.1